MWPPKTLSSHPSLQRRGGRPVAPAQRVSRARPRAVPPPPQWGCFCAHLCVPDLTPLVATPVDSFVHGERGQRGGPGYVCLARCVRPGGRWRAASRPISFFISGSSRPVSLPNTVCFAPSLSPLCVTPLPVVFKPAVNTSLSLFSPSLRAVRLFAPLGSASTQCGGFLPALCSSQYRL